MRYPSYLNLLQSGELERRVRTAKEILNSCILCPWECKVDRTKGELGQCRIGAEARVYSYMPHHGEERPLSGKYGSGTIFFSGCNMHCQFCQNADISQERYGLPIGAEKLAIMMLDLQKKGCHNINLVSPTHIVPQFLEALHIAASMDLHLPIVYNTGGYDAVGTLALLDGIIDIYMPDMKYADAQVAEELSKIPDYPKHNKKAVRIMHQQVDDLITNTQGIALTGLIIRHLVLPQNLAGTREIMHFISTEISSNTYVNIMDQYRPDYLAQNYPAINRRPTADEFQSAVKEAINCGIRRIDHLIT